jgi:hypothetical protein
MWLTNLKKDMKLDFPTPFEPIKTLIDFRSRLIFFMDLKPSI